MNSMSRNNCNDDRLSNFRNDDRLSNCKKESEIILKCKTGFPITILETTPTGSTFSLTPINLNLCRFSNQRIKFEFAANIVTAATTVTLNFQIVKLCNNQFVPTAVGPIWTFDRVASTGSESFAFIVCDCDCDSCPADCCTYSVIVTAVSTEVGTTIINNPTLSALVVENKTQCC